MKKQTARPPRVAEGLLRFCNRRDDSYSLMGDIQEEFTEIAETRGIRAARRWYWKQTFRSIPALLKDSFLWGGYLFKSYIKLAWRNIRKYKTFSFINVAGLAMGLACSALIIMYVVNELTYDQYHRDAERIYRISTQRKSFVGEFWMAASPSALAPALKKNYPQVAAAARLVPPFENSDNVLVTSKLKHFFQKRIYFADEEIFQTLTIPFLYGNPATALNRPHTVVLNESTAIKYFNRKDPIGETIKMELDYDLGPVKAEDFTITGVVEDQPANSHIKFNLLVSMPTMLSHQTKLDSDWINPHPKYTYIKLKANVGAAEFEKQLQDLASQAKAAYTKRTGRKLAKLEYKLLPISRIHMYSEYRREPEAKGNWYYIYIYSIIALLILAIGCMNFMNLSTALSTNRTKEVGLRKVTGARRLDLISQFIGESFLITLIAFTCALWIITLILPQFNSMAGTQLSLTNLAHPSVIVTIICLIAIISVGAGYYPAFILTLYNPTTILQDRFYPKAKGSGVQKLLVLGQFTFSIFLVVCTLIVFRQMNYMKGRALGFQREQKIILKIRSNQPYFRRNYEAIKKDFVSHANIYGATISSWIPGRKSNSGYYMTIKGRNANKPTWVKALTVDADFIPQFNIKMAAGRAFSEKLGNDQKGAYILNEAAVKRLGFASPKDALGKVMTAHYHRLTKKVVGVTRDFHYQGMQDEVEPLILDIEKSLMESIILSIDTKLLPETLPFIKETWQTHFPGAPFEFGFLDKEFDTLYQYEERMGKLLGMVTSLAVTIACLGLLGLVAFSAQIRQREIGIRKVLGASVANIVTMMSRQYVKLVLLASLLALPAAWYVMNLWLKDFAYRIQPGVLVFLLSAVSALVISLITITFQASRVAKQNPIQTIRCQ